MKPNLIYSVLAIALLSSVSACKDDDETPIAGISFEVEEQEVTESDGTIASFHPDEDEDGVGRVVTAKLVFDRALAGDVVIEFDVDGSASPTSTSTDVNDFEIEETSENVTIDGSKMTISKGAEEAVFSIRIFEDYAFEIQEDLPTTEEGVPYEEIEISLESIVSGPGKLGENLDHVVKILEDDTYVFVQWDPVEANITDVDMDLFIFIDSRLAGSSRRSTTTNQFEAVVIPAGFPAATYGFAYVYKSGTSNDLDILSEIGCYGGTLTTVGGESGVAYTATAKYTQANLNPYTDPNNPGAQIAQSMTKSGLSYTAVSQITVPGSGSRTIERTSALQKRAEYLRMLRSEKVTVLEKFQ